MQPAARWRKILSYLFRVIPQKGQPLICLKKRRKEKGNTSAKKSPKLWKEGEGHRTRNRDEERL